MTLFIILFFFNANFQFSPAETILNFSRNLSLVIRLRVVFFTLNNDLMHKFTAMHKLIWES